MTDLTALRTNISPFYDATHPTYGATGNGSTPDDAALLSVNAAAGTAGIVQLLPGTYRVQGSLTITAALRPVRGAMLKPDAGVTITVNGPVEAGAWQWMDLSAGGAFSFLNNKSIDAYLPQWFGVVGDGVTDDQPALQAMINSISDFGVIRFSSNLQMRINNTVTMMNRDGLQFLSDQINVDSLVLQPGATMFIWGGATGGTMFDLNSCGFITMKGLFFDAGSIYVQSRYGWTPNAANRCVSLRMVGGTRIGTQCLFENCQFFNGRKNKDWAGVYIADDTNGNNQEYHRFHHCHFTGVLGGSARITNQWWQNWTGVNFTHDNTTITVSRANPSKPGIFRTDGSDVGVRVRLENATADGYMLDTVTTQIIDEDTAVLRDAPGRDGTAGYGIIDESYGRGCVIGNSFNAKGIRFFECSFNSLAIGLDSQGGSFSMWNGNFPDNECNISVTGSQSEPSAEYFSNSENSRQHLFYFPNGGGAYASHNSRYSPASSYPLTAANSGYFVLMQSGRFLLEGCSFDQKPRPGNPLFDLRTTSAGSGRLTLRRNTYGNGNGPWSDSDLGITRDVVAAGVVIQEFDMGHDSPYDYRIIRAPFRNDTARCQQSGIHFVEIDAEWQTADLPAGFITTALNANQNRVELWTRTADNQLHTIFLPIDTLLPQTNIDVPSYVSGGYYRYDCSANPHHVVLHAGFPTNFEVTLAKVDDSVNPLLIDSNGSGGSYSGAASIELTRRGTAKLLHLGSGVWDVLYFYMP